MKLFHFTRIITKIVQFFECHSLFCQSFPKCVNHSGSRVDLVLLLHDAFTQAFHFLCAVDCLCGAFLGQQFSFAQSPAQSSKFLSVKLSRCAPVFADRHAGNKPIVALLEAVSKFLANVVCHRRILLLSGQYLGRSGWLGLFGQKLRLSLAFRLPSAIGLAHLFRGLAKVSKWQLVSWIERIAVCMAMLRVYPQYQVQEVVNAQ
jgi:hypothetical protein